MRFHQNKFRFLFVGLVFCCLGGATYMILAAFERLPKGIKADQEPHYALDSIEIPDTNIEPGTRHSNTFGVVKQHHVIREHGHTIGVRFNVETVPAALPEHLRAPRLTPEEINEKRRASSAMHYNIERQCVDDDNYKKRKQCKPVYPDTIHIEAMSEPPPNLIYYGGNGFLGACVMAFAQHLPLQLSPDDIWSLITYAFAKHVDAHAEELRSKFVSHEGKKRILVETGPGFRMSDPEKSVPGEPAVEWEREVFAQFSEEVKKHIGESTHATITAEFSTTSPSSRAASEITLMSAMKNYFSFGMTTLCGIPNISLLGTEDDWVALRERAEELGKLTTTEFSEYWMPVLLPVLDEFIDTYRGNVNHGFWQSMVKLRHNGLGSGYATFISGWIQILFPYLKGGRLGQRLRPWHEMYFHGPEPEDFPPLISSVPVDWEYYGKVYNLDFHAGVGGVVQDATDGALKPVATWYVTHSPPKGRLQALKDITEEINALLLGHKEEGNAEEIDRNQPWYQRVEVLWAEASKLGRNITLPFEIATE